MMRVWSAPEWVAALPHLAQRLQEGVVLCDDGGAVLYLNPPAERLFKTTLVAARGMALADLVGDMDLYNRALNALAGLQVDRVECLLGEPRGEHAVSFVPFREGEGTFLYLLCHDIAEKRQLEQLQKNFVENVSHELRTPLTSIQGFVEALEGGALAEPEHALKFLRIIKEHTQRLVKLVNAQIDLLKLARGMVSFRFQPLHLRELVDSVGGIFRQALADHRLQWVVEVEPGFQLVADRDRIEQVLINLVDNAVKFTPDGGRLTVRSERLGQQSIISVSDTGCGIPREERSFIFRKFYKARGRAPRPARGFGLGLSITEEIVRAHQGVILVDSEIGRGTTIKLTLPPLEPSPEPGVAP